MTFSTGKSWEQIASEYSKIVDPQIAGVDVKGLDSAKQTHSGAD